MERNQPDQVTQDQSLTQKLQLTDSELTESIIGGQAGENIVQVHGNNQAARDLVQIIIGGEVSKIDREKILGKYLSSERLDELTENSRVELEEIQSKLEQARERVNALHILVENKIKEIKPDASRGALLNLIYELQEILTEKDNFEKKLELVASRNQSEREAALWLLKNIDEIVDSMTEFLFTQNPLPPLRQNILRKKLSIIELKERFSKTIATYMSALFPFIFTGRADVKFSRKDYKFIYLDFSNQIYISCLENLKYGLIMANYESGKISVEAAEVVCLYINRFLIDQEFSL